MHAKRYRSNLVYEGATLGDGAAVAGIPRPESDDVGGSPVGPAHITYLN
jgi:hypothetical protein